jgi:predicted DNA-binding transcriptional regulator AlpA
MSKAPCPEAPAALLFTSEDLTQILRTSLATIIRMRAARQIPPPLRLRGQLRWPAATIHKWIALGMPDAATFENAAGEGAAHAR